MAIKIKKEPRCIVGINISADQLTALALRFQPLLSSECVITRELAQIKGDDGISAVLSDVFAGKRLFHKEVWLNLDLQEPAVNFRRLTLPVMPEKEIAEAVKWNLKDKVPLDISAAKCAYDIIDETQKGGSVKNLNVMAALVDKSSIDRYVGIFKKAGIILSGISVTPFSISNYLKNEKIISDGGDPVLVCHMQKTYSYLCVFARGKLDFARQVPFGSDNFLKAMTSVLISDRGRVELTVQEARVILDKFGIPSQADEIRGANITAGQIISMTRPVIEHFSGEITRSMDYYQKEIRAQKIEKILLSGEGPQIKHLDEHLSGQSRVPAQNLVMPQGLVSAEIPGAALGQNGGINLLPEELIDVRGQELKKGVMRVLAAAVTGFFLFSFIAVIIETAGYKKQLDLARSQQVLLKDIKDLQSRMDQRAAVILSIKSAQAPADIILKELSRITPEYVVFDEVSLNCKMKSLKLRGRVSAGAESAQGLLSDFMGKLEKTLFIKEANIANTRNDGSGKVSSFEANCTLK